MRLKWSDTYTVFHLVILFICNNGAVVYGTVHFVALVQTNKYILCAAIQCPLRPVFNIWCICFMRKVMSMICRKETSCSILDPSYHLCFIDALYSWSSMCMFDCAKAGQNSIFNLTHMIPNPPLTNSSSDLISGSKRQKNLYLNLVHFNSTPKVP